MISDLLPSMLYPRYKSPQALILKKTRPVITGNNSINLYFSPNIVRANKSSRMRVTGLRAHLKKIAYDFVWKKQGRKQLGRPKRRWEDNVKINLGQIDYEGHVD
jgi:hypothetical protein